MHSFVRSTIQALTRTLRPARETQSAPAAPTFEWSDALIDALAARLQVAIDYGEGQGWTLEAIVANVDAESNPAEWLSFLRLAELRLDACNAQYATLGGEWNGYWDYYTAAHADIASAVLALGILYARHQEAAQAA